jgi:nucleotide-binding universal stress UspA family protein
MDSPAPVAAPVLDSILHPSDFSEASRVAFAHALKAALIARARLTLVHVAPTSGSPEWSDFPGVRETLERWGLLPPGSHKSAVPHLGIDVKKVIAHDDDPVRSVVHYLEAHPTDLIVLATNQHEGRMRWMHKSVAATIARKAGQLTLFIPAGVAGFISLADGSVLLTSILIPLADARRHPPAVAAAVRIVRRLGIPAGAFTLLHVGDEEPMDDVFRPDVPGWTWDTVMREGDVTGAILKTAEETRAGLIVMSTEGRHGFLDGLRGSTSEQVLRRAPCPLLAVPESSLAAESLGG